MWVEVSFTDTKEQTHVVPSPHVSPTNNLAKILVPVGSRHASRTLHALSSLRRS